MRNSSDPRLRRRLPKDAAYPKLAGHDVVVYTDAYNDPSKAVEQVSGCDAVVLTNERVSLPRRVIERLPSLKFICQTSVKVAHIDIAACTEQGIVFPRAATPGTAVISRPLNLRGGSSLRRLRHLPHEVARLKQGHWQSTVGTRLFGKTLGVYAFGNIGSAMAKVDAPSA